MKTVETNETCAAENMAASVGEGARCCVDAGVNALHGMSEKARQARRNADGYVRENPWLAIGVTAGIGVLVGFLLRGRREW